MKMLIGLKYQKWLLIIPLAFIFLAACINYLYNLKILRIIQIITLCFLTSFVVMYIWLILENYPLFNNLWFVWLLYYLIGTPVGFYIIALQEKDIKQHDRNQLTKVRSNK